MKIISFSFGRIAQKFHQFQIFMSRFTSVHVTVLFSMYFSHLFVFFHLFHQTIFITISKMTGSMVNATAKTVTPGNSVTNRVTSSTSDPTVIMNASLASSDATP